VIANVLAVEELTGRYQRDPNYYVEIREMGFNLTHVDVGGGLGVDYEGSRTTRPASMNYTTREYANDVVSLLGTVCKQFDKPMPHPLTKPGRGLPAPPPADRPAIGFAAWQSRASAAK